MHVEINQSFVEANTTLTIDNTNFLITPPLNEKYWIMRVPLSDKQAVVCFPKFGTIGIGFQKEEDWNTNLPSRYNAEKIFNHIAHNKGDDSIQDEACIEAIKLLQNKIIELGL